MADHHDRDDQAIDAFADSLDAITLGLSVPDAANDPLAAFAARLAQVGQPIPADEDALPGHQIPSRTKRQIWSALMAGHGVRPDSPPRPATPGGAGSALTLNPWSPPQSPDRPKARRHSDSVLHYLPAVQPSSTFLMVVLVLVMVGASFAWIAPERGFAPGALASPSPATLEASPSAPTVQPVREDECTLPLRDLTETATPSSASLASAEPRSYELAGTLDPSTIHAVTSASRTWMACEAYDPSRTVGIESARFIKEELYGQDDTLDSFLARFETVTALSHQIVEPDWHRYVVVLPEVPQYSSWEAARGVQPGDVFLLSDGRVAVVLSQLVSVEEFANWPDLPNRSVEILVFSQDGNRWLLDERFNACAGDCKSNPANGRTCDATEIRIDPAPAQFLRQRDLSGGIWMLAITSDPNVVLLGLPWYGDRPLEPNGVFSDVDYGAKFMWVSDDDLANLTMSAVPQGDDAEASISIPVNAASSNGLLWTLGMDFPEPGCWDVTIEATIADTGEPVTATVVMEVIAPPIATPSAASPESSPAVPDEDLYLQPVTAEECVVDARSRDEMSDLLSTPATIPDRLYEPAVKVDPSTEGHVIAAARSWHACSVFGVASQRLAMESPQYIWEHGGRTRHDDPSRFDERQAATRTLSETILDDDWTTYAIEPDTAPDLTNDESRAIVQRGDVWLLPDGRVGAVISELVPPGTHNEPPGRLQPTVAFQIYTLVGDQWLLDETLWLCPGGCDDPSAMDSASPVADSCMATEAHNEPINAPWMTHDLLRRLPWIVVEHDNANVTLLGLLWYGDRPLQPNGVFPADGMNAKLMWYSSVQIRDLRITAVPVDNPTAEPVPIMTGAANAPEHGPATTWPSMMALPGVGCWEVTLTATVAGTGDPVTGTVIMAVVAPPAATPES